MFLWNIYASTRKWRRAGRPDVGPDPWDARGLEWMTASPVPEHNFDSEIEVERLDDFGHRKYGVDENPPGGVRTATAEEVAHDGSNTKVHLPSPSYWPIVLGGGLLLVGYGLIYNLWLAAAGLCAFGGGPSTAGFWSRPMTPMTLATTTIITTMAMTTAIPLGNGGPDTRVRLSRSAG